MEWLIALFCSTLLALIAYFKRKLSFSGLFAAIAVGTSIFGATGIYGFIVLFFFFVSSTLLGMIKRVSHSAVERVVEKGDRRDYLQVFANGGLAAASALAYALLNDAVFLVVMCASLAAATADTWASELGRWSKARPIHILTREKVEPGTSGAITTLGTLASVSGAVFLALVSIPLILQGKGNLGFESYMAIMLIVVAGWLGNWMDTYVGAKWQVRYQCPDCLAFTEKTVCHTQTVQVAGIRWMNNDMVNAICTVSAGFFAVFLTLMFRFL
ncbi:DUF92 domain-containing protein [Bacillus horti]|uniref:Uncharacterized protein (TIGR00297 family) n=1 Tax=Caldalkalibacillus horti TaxID=77523 RepID=A0ABT9W3J4_9BACI|nr:DUF92 domain-containing protein [Bacillus horti]MDQ0167804.1 uncharacterized protein (TIGR00297 family) [Bacillus horti]